MKLKATLIFLIIFCLSEASSQEVRPFARSPKALFMGDAFTSIADDDYTLFYNPAALGKHRGVELYFVNLNLGATNAIEETDRFEDLPREPVDIVDRFSGYPLYLQAGVTPGFKMGPFALSYLVQNSTSIVLRNQTYPSIDIDHRYDRGIVAGFGHSFRRGPWGETSLGVSFKAINREGMQGSFDVFGTKLLGLIDDGLDDIDELKKSLGYSKGKGYGYDFGILHTMRYPGTEVNLGLSILDIADTRFKVTSGEAQLPAQEMTINFGSSLRQKWGPFEHTLSFDLHPLNWPIEFGRKVHLGYNARFMMAELMVGLNGGYLTYGAGVNIWPIKIMAGITASELGGGYKQEKGGRALIYLSLLTMDFDL